jgi:membrane associated rhomboid family serine protease
MIPIRDTIRSRQFPLVNTTFIVINVLIFFFEASLGPRSLDRFFYAFGLVPARFWMGGDLGRWVPIFSSMFLHGGWLHLISNMLALYIFGDNVEDRMGHLRYLIFYLLGGTLAGLAHLWAYSESQVPTVGASGAIAAVLGAYLVLYPRARIITLIPIFFFIQIVEIPAPFYLVFWFLLQLLNGTLALSSDMFQQGGVAWWAHIGGFIAGIVLVMFFARRRQRRDYLDEYYPW